MLITVILILGVALPIVRWRDPATGQPLPQELAIFSPFIFGAAFFGTASLILRLIGLPAWLTQVKGDSNGPASRGGEEDRGGEGVRRGERQGPFAHISETLPHR
jgi:hypothetical protein